MYSGHAAHAFRPFGVAVLAYAQRKKAEQTDDTPREFADETENAKPCGITKYLSDFAGFPVSYDGEATYFSSGKETFEAIMEAVRGAKNSFLPNTSSSRREKRGRNF